MSNAAGLPRPGITFRTALRLHRRCAPETVPGGAAHHRLFTCTGAQAGIASASAAWIAACAAANRATGTRNGLQLT
jgi:hypothetical protein